MKIVIQFLYNVIHLCILINTLIVHAQVISFGDSWAVGGFRNLERRIQRKYRNVKVSNYAIGGTRAEQFAERPELLPNAVTLANAKFVWLSIGGNDYHLGKGRREPDDILLKKIETWIDKMLTELYKVHKDVKVSIFSYDILNLEEPGNCRDFANAIFGRITTLERNTLYHNFGKMIKRSVQKFPNTKFIDQVWGSLQKDGKIPNAPNLNFNSPKVYFADCIHINEMGWNVVNEVFFQNYWDNELDLLNKTQI